MTARFRMAHLTELKAGVREAKLAEFQRNDTHRHVHAEESSAETGYNTTRVGWFVLGWGVGFGVGFFFPFSSPPLPRRGGNYSISQNFFKRLFLHVFAYAKTIPHNKLKIVGQVNLLLLIFLRQKDINAEL